MQGNQKDRRWTAAGITLASSSLLVSWFTLVSAATATRLTDNVGTHLPTSTLLAQADTPPANQPAAEPAVEPAAEPTPPAATSEIIAPVNTSVPAQPNNPEETLTGLVTLMLGVLVLLIGSGIAILWFYRRSVVNEVATIVRTQLNEMTELENKVHNATRNLNRVLAEADDLSGELQGRSSNFQREIAAQREVLYDLIEELAEFKVQTAKNWERELEDINGKLEATATDFNEVAIALRNQAKQRLETLQTDAEVEGQRILQRFTTSEAEFSRHVGVIKEETQRRKSAFFDELDRKESVLSDQMGSLQSQAASEQERIIAGMREVGNSFGPKLSEIELAAKAKIEQQRDTALNHLKTSEDQAVQELAEIQASALG
ncbi:MAG: hypothetical protein AAFY72_03685, partial [Cyanobacteria bacterium J06649_4]